jgi:hypothetical protein
MTATRKQHSTKVNPAVSLPAKGVLYLAFELGWDGWKLAFGTSWLTILVCAT